MNFKAKTLCAAFLSVACAVGMVGCSSTSYVRQKPAVNPLTEDVPESIALIFPDANNFCGPITGGAKNPKIELDIQRFRTLMTKSATAARMLRSAERYPDADQGERPLWICFKKLTDERPPYAFYRWGRGVMVINTHMFDHPLNEGKQIAAAAHELRHVEQDGDYQAIRYLMV